MKKIDSLDKVKEIELQGLKTFKEFCKKYDLKYSLAAGSMIGAVRHKGFIPWDDDIDIYMVRDEYDKFMNLIRHGKKLEDKNFTVRLPEDENYLYPFVKIVNKNTLVYEKNVEKKYALGLWVDIFPLDYCGDKISEVKKMHRFMKNTSKKLMLSAMHYSGNTLIDKLKNIYIWLFKHIFGGNYQKYKDKKLHYRFPKEGKYIGQMIWYPSKMRGLHDIYLSDWFQEYVEIEFEGEQYPIFSCYDEILRQRYGSYMRIPKENERKTHEMLAFYVK